MVENKDQIIVCEVPSLPSRKCFTDTQYSFIKRRWGKESVPFMNLSPGKYKILFTTKTKKQLCLVKVWISHFGDAWQILKSLEESCDGC